MRDLLRGRAYTIDASNSRTSGQIYKDSDNIWGNYTVSDRATVAADAQYGAAVTWDYFKNVHGRLGIANDGKAAYSRVHYGRRYNNAFWSDACFCMTYGDGDGVNLSPLVALDIAGHEMSHGVNARTANLIYSGESGGLNEANSDILGTMVEFHANNSHDTPDYLIGEEVFVGNVSGSATQKCACATCSIRPPTAARPTATSTPSATWTCTTPRAWPTSSSTCWPKAPAPGPTAASTTRPTTCNGSQFAGIGRAKAQKIWYRALTVYFTSSTDYAGARVGTINAAKDLYGATSAEANAVATAWSAVKVN